MKKSGKSEASFKEKLSDFLDMPGEIVADIPKITLVGNKEVTIENYNGIIEFGENVVRLNTKVGIIKIVGVNIDIKNITAEEIIVFGGIRSFEFVS